MHPSNLPGLLREGTRPAGMSVPRWRFRCAHGQRALWAAAETAGQMIVEERNGEIWAVGKRIEMGHVGA